jgi:RNA polymerase sigma factor (TIGR02999 family)
MDTMSSGLPPDQFAAVSGEAGEVTRLLGRIRAGDRGAEQAVFQLLYRDLRKLAGHYLGREGGAESLNPTALVNEIYLRIFGGSRPALSDRHHFLALSCQVMRRLLVDRARARKAQKRLGTVPLGPDAFARCREENPDRILLVDRGLEKLASVSVRSAKVVEMRYFGNLEFEEIAELLGVSARTVRRDFQMAKLWLYEEFQGGPKRESGMS